MGEQTTCDLLQSPVSAATSIKSPPSSSSHAPGAVINTFSVAKVSSRADVFGDLCAPSCIPLALEEPVTPNVDDDSGPEKDDPAGVEPLAERKAPGGFVPLIGGAESGLSGAPAIED